MGASKSDYFTKSQNKTSAIFKALGHPARLAIVEHLLKVDTCICGDIVTELPLAQATISQHLRELKQSEIIRGSIDGNSICYCLDKKAFDMIETYLRTINSIITKKLNCC